MSKILRFVGRAAMAPVFVIGGKNAIDNAENIAPMIEKTQKQLGVGELPVSSKQLVQINGVSMIGLGATFGLGIFSRLSALGLFTSLGLTTLAGHRFWEEQEPETKQQQTLSFLLNTAILGGLLGFLAAPKAKHKKRARKARCEARKARRAERKAERKAKVESAKVKGFKKVNGLGARAAKSAVKAKLS